MFYFFHFGVLFEFILNSTVTTSGLGGKVFLFDNHIEVHPELDGHNLEFHVELHVKSLMCLIFTDVQNVQILMSGILMLMPSSPFFYFQYLGFAFSTLGFMCRRHSFGCGVRGTAC